MTLMAVFVWVHHNKVKWENLIIIYFLHYNGKSKLHLNHMNSFRTRHKHLPSFKKDTGKIVGVYSQDTQCIYASIEVDPKLTKFELRQML